VTRAKWQVAGITDVGGGVTENFARSFSPRISWLWLEADRPRSAPDRGRSGAISVRAEAPHSFVRRTVSLFGDRQ